MEELTYKKLVWEFIMFKWCSVESDVLLKQFMYSLPIILWYCTKDLFYIYDILL